MAAPDLARFVTAQEGTYPRALAELRAGRKATHWMWFIFPQLKSLGRSGTAKLYGIADLAEASAYLAHPVLGPRLLDCTRALLAQPEDDPVAVMGPVDAMKLRSSATLFRAAGARAEMQALLDRFYGGTPCPLTEAELRRQV